MDETRESAVTERSAYTRWHKSAPSKRSRLSCLKIYHNRPRGSN